MESTATVTEDPPAAAADPPAATVSVGDSVRKLVQLLTLFFCLFLLVRTLFIEPFGVPTGSMAPALYGNHRAAACPRCGQDVCVGTSDKKHVQNVVACPNCGQDVSLVDGAASVLGDRLLVDKAIYHARDPHRWEVAVFHCPVDDHKLYVKRVVGLPGEAILLKDGDTYADGGLLRKTYSEFTDCRLPVFVMDREPAAIGWATRWVAENSAATPQLPAGKPTAVPDIGRVVQGSALVLDGREQSLGLTYHHRDLDTKKDEAITDRLGYNGDGGSAKHVHDFAIECELEVTGGPGVFACRLTDGGDSVKADIPIGDGTLVLASDAGMPSATVAGFALQPGKTYRLAFAFVDRRATLQIDGVDILPPLDLDPPTKPRLGVACPLQFGIRGATVTVRHLVIYRDVHYRTDGSGNEHATRTPLPLGPDEYFLLGDNSTDSFDGRAWAKPAVPRKDFLGKPFLIHQPLRVGQVPVLGRVQTVDWDRFRLLK